MKKLVGAIRSRLNGADSRTKSINKNISVSLALKPVTLVLYFLLIKVSLDILGNQYFGVWTTIFTFVGSIAFLDVGLGSGLRNKLVHAIFEKDYLKARAYVSTAYCSMIILVAGIVLLFLPFLYFADLAGFFKISQTLSLEVKLSVFVCVLGVGLVLVLKLLNILFYSHQNTFYPDLIWIASQAAVLCLLLLCRNIIEGSLIRFALIYAVTPVLIYTSLSMVFFRKRFLRLKPSITLFRKEYIKDIMTLGLKFFVIQISGIVLYSIDNVLITYLFDSNAVTDYNIPFRYFNILVMAFSTILLPYWSMTTNAVASGDTEWIKKAVKRLMLLWGAVAVGGIVMLFCSPIAYNILAGDGVKVDLSLSVVILVFCLAMNWAGIFNTITYGMGLITAQMWLSVIGIFVNVTLSIVLVKYFNAGLIAIPLSYAFYAVIVSGLVFLQLKRGLQSQLLKNNIQ
ncbi:MAG: hypothetical protein DI535_16910 [Citrobacter freundii]|nr:MAG: hypothetical protein DI535_16910 [Citrobacter freundii]